MEHNSYRRGDGIRNFLSQHLHEVLEDVGIDHDAHETHRLWANIGDQRGVCRV